MNNEFEYELPVDSPELPVRDAGVVHTVKQFSDGLTMDLTDHEIQQALQIVLPLKKKFRTRFASKLGDPFFDVEKAMKMVDEMEDELVTKLAERLNMIATVDVGPLFEGHEMVIEFVGVLPGHSTVKYGLDHEKKEWEVCMARETGESFLGESKLSDV